MVIDTISPRLFEYATVGNVMVMHEGAYGGIVHPDVHYIPIKKDYSNIEEVVEKMNSTAYCRQLVDNAYRDLIGSGTYSYKTFVRWFDQMLAVHRPVPREAIRAQRMQFYFRQVWHSRQYVVPARGREVIVPIHDGLPYLGRSVLRRLLLMVPIVGPVVRRRGGDPIKLFEQWAVSLGRIIFRPELMKIARVYLGDKELRRNLAPDHLLRDLCLLSEIYDSMRPGRDGFKKFYVLPKFDRLSGTFELRSLRHEARPLTLVAWRTGDSRFPGEALWTDLLAVLRCGAVKAIRWSHLRPSGGILVKFMGRPAFFFSAP